MVESIDKNQHIMGRALRIAIGITLLILLLGGGASAISISGVLSVSDSITSIGTVDWAKLSQMYNPNATGSNVAIWQIQPPNYDTNPAPSSLKFYARLEDNTLSILVNGSEDDSLRMMLNTSGARISNGSLTPNDRTTVRYDPRYTYLYYTLQNVLNNLKSNSIISSSSNLAGNYIYRSSFTDKVYILGAWYLTTSYNAGVPAHNIPFGNGVDNCNYNPGTYSCTSANGIAQITNNFAYTNPKYGYMIAWTHVDNSEYSRISIDDAVWLRRDGSWGGVGGNRKWATSLPAKVDLWSQKTWSWAEANYWYAVAADNVSITGSTAPCTIGTCYLNSIDVNTFIPTQKGAIEWNTQTALLFSENWDSGSINTSRWTKYGSPQPEVLSGGRNSSYAFDPQGDSWCGSGVVSTQSFRLSDGLKVEWYGKGQTTGQIHHMGVDLTLATTPITEGYCQEGGYYWIARTGFIPPSDSASVYFNGPGDGTSISYPDDNWHKYGFEILTDGKIKFYMDDVLKYTSIAPINFTQYNNQKLQIDGRSLYGTILVDDIVVTRLGAQTAGQLVNITISPSSATVTSGQTQQFTASGADANGNAVAITPTWSSSNTAVGAINSTGVFTAVTPGTTTITATSGSVSGSATVTVTSGLVAEYHFNGNASDSSGNGNHGTISGATFVQGMSGQGLSFDGNNHYVTIPYTSPINFNGNTNFTLMAWIKTSYSTSTQSIIKRGAMGFNTFEVKLYVNQQAQAHVFRQNYGTVYLTGSSTVTDGNWHLITATYSMVNGRLTLYVDGVSEATNNDVNIPGTVSSTGYNWYIGTEQDLSSDFNGLIDDVRIYNRALSASEIQAQYNAIADTTLPSISITSPTNSQTTGTASINISGTASDNNNLSKVEVKVGAGSWQNASGTTTWSAQVTLSQGSNTISARATDTWGNNATTSVNVIYNLPVLTTITVSSAASSVVSGNTQTFTAAPRDQYGNPFSAAVTWSISNTTVGAITSSGVFTANKAGTATITGSSGLVSGTAAVTVTAGTLAVITITPSTATVTSGQTRQFTASGFDANGNPVAMTPVWSDSNNAAVNINTAAGTIDSLGVFTALNQGTTTIYASNSGLSASAIVTVIPAGQLAISANPSIVTVNTPTYVTFSVTNNSQPMSAVTVSLSGAATGSGTTDLNGQVTLQINAALGTITATASKTGYAAGTTTIAAVNPLTLNITSSLSNVIVNTPTYVTFSVTSNSTPVSGAVVSLNGAATGSGTTDTSGQVTILINAALGTITATASKTGTISGTTTLNAMLQPVLTITANPSNVTVNTPTYVTFSVTNNSQPVSGATVSMSGAATGSGTTDLNGQVTLQINAALGTITATASKTGYAAGTTTIAAVNPLTLNITSSLSNVIVNTPTYVTFSVTSNSTPVSGAVVSLNGAATGSGTTNTNGQVTIFINAALGTITATASKTGYTAGTTTLIAVNPLTLTITSSTSNVIVNTPTYVTFSVTSNNTPVSGAVVSLNGAATGSGTTDTNGQITLLINAALGTITATASKTGTISGTTTMTATLPPVLTITTNPANVTVNTPTYVTFTVTNNNQPVSGAVVDLAGAGAGSGTTNTNGQVTLLVNAALGTITATASKTGYISGTTTINVGIQQVLTITASPPNVTVNTPTYVTFSVTVNDQTVSGAVVDVTGAATGSGTTNTNGEVTILINAAFGTITATASKTGYASGTATLIANPAGSQELVINAVPSSVSVNTPTYVTFAVAANNAAVSNAFVSLNGAATGSGTTDSNGHVTMLINAAFGTITATATKTGFSSGTFTMTVGPGVERQLNLTAASSNIIAQIPTYVTFRVTSGGTPASNAIVYLSGAASGSGTTDSIGQVAILVNAAYGIITATASKTGFTSATTTIPTKIGGSGQQLEITSNPSSLTVNAPAYITFSITAGGSSVNNAIVFLTGAGQGIGSTDANGRVTMLVNPAFGTLTATASKTGYSSGFLILQVEQGTTNSIPVQTPSVNVSSGVVTRARSSTSSDGSLTFTITPSPASLFDAPGYQVIETLPQELTYINTTAIGVNQQGNTITFTQIGSSGFTYNVMAPSGSGSYSITGTFRDELNNIGNVQDGSPTSSGNGTGVTGRYDVNGNGRIEKNEAVQSVIDYFSGIITRQEAIEVVIRYFSG